MDRFIAKVVVDSNILIALLNRNDPNHASVGDLAALLTEENYELIAPVVYLWEIDAYLRHPEKSKKHLANTSAELRVTTYDVTSGLYARTYSAAMTAVKGTDRVFVSLAKDHGVPLITNDKQILKNAGDLGIAASSAGEFIRLRSNKYQLSSPDA